jgi:hypothetical protein
MWRLIRTWITHNHKAYYSYVVLCGLGVYSFWWYACVGYYRQRNYLRSLPVAIEMEAQWARDKPAEEDDDDEEEEE